jgi:hypothetical protein
MQSATFRGRRGIAPLRALAARADGWRLVLDKPPLVPVGQSFANVVRDAAEHVYGVAYEITAADLAHVDLTEGVLIGNYARVEIEVETLGAPERFAAFTLTSERRDDTLRPSLRYMSLLVEGALEHGLPSEWIERLRAVPAVAETALAIAFRKVLDETLKRSGG